MSEPSEKLAEGTLISHLLELRSRLVKAAAAIGIAFIPAVVLRNEIFENLAHPLIAQLPQGGSLIATGVMSPFITPIKLAFFVAVFAAMPVVLYQIWAFVAPGLYRREKRFAVPLLVSSILLFYVGVFFAYRFIFPAVFHFLAANGPAGLQMMPDVNNFLEFALRTFLAFGVAFEMPVVVVLLVLTGLVKRIDPSLTGLAVTDQATLEAALEESRNS
jgi:sec-independent protein translocase protein TatC